MGTLPQLVIHVDEHGADGGKALIVPAVADGVDHLLRGLQDVLGGALLLGDDGANVGGGLGELPKQRLVRHDLGILPHIGGGGSDIGDLQKIGRVVSS